jgi:hypothetical protein
VARYQVVLVVVASACSFKPRAGAGDATLGPDAPVYLDARVDGAPGAAKRKTITIPQNQVGGPVTGFPMWFVATDTDLKAHATAGGLDIYFTKTDGTALPYERVHWDPTTGHVEAWVKVDLTDAATNVIELRYGDPGPATAPDARAVFANGFISVWHLDDTLATSTVADATTTANGTASGLAPSQQVAAQLGGGFSFNGSSSQIAFANHVAGNSPHTISAWVNLSAPTDGGFASIVTIGPAQVDQARFFHAKYSPNLGCGFYSDDLTGGPDISDGHFHLVHWVYDGAASVLYKDGSNAKSGAPGNQPNTSGSNGLIGNSPTGFSTGGTNYIRGVVDEVRIASVARDQAWITTELNNQKAPRMFYMLGPEMTVP